MKKILWALAIIIIPAFVLWGATGLRDKGQYAGKLYGKEVTLDTYRQNYYAVRRRALMTYGENFKKVEDQLKLDEAAWDRIIMLHEAKQKNIRVSDDEVIARIAAMPIFQTEDGLFSQKSYDAILTSAFRMEPREFEEETRQSITVEKMFEEIFKGIPELTAEDLAGAAEFDDNRQGETGETAEDEIEETPEERDARVMRMVTISKRMDVYNEWRTEVYARAKLESYIEPAVKEPAEGPAEEKPTEEELPTE